MSNQLRPEIPHSYLINSIDDLWDARMLSNLVNYAKYSDEVYPIYTTRKERSNQNA